MAQNNQFNKRISNVSQGVWSKITQIDELKGRWISGAQLDPQALGRLKKSVLITSSGASTRIEGARLSDADVEKLMRGVSMQKFTDRDKQEVQGYYELLNNVFNSHKGLRFSENTLKHFHQELLKYVEKDKEHRGEYKKKENKVVMLDQLGAVKAVLFETAPPFLTPKKMQELVEWTQTTLLSDNFHPLLVVGNFLVEFLSIHPFNDGNGRLSRVLTNLLLLKQGYAFMPYISHEKIIEDNKAEYYIALRKTQNTFYTKKENLEPWLNFFLDCVLLQSQFAIALLSQENIEKLLSVQQMIVWRYLQKAKEASPREISQQANVARPTINQAANKLLRLKKIERVGLGRSTKYRIVE